MPPSPPDWHAWLTGLLILAMVATLAVGRFGADIVMMGALLVLLVAGVVQPDQAVAGFASPGVITVAFLYIVATAMRETGAMNMLTARVLGRPKTVREAQARLALPVAGLSAFVNNTPIVAMFLPTLDRIARRNMLPASKLFMPLSFASILGGVCTLIGTSTTVVVAGMLAQHASANPDAGIETIGMFTLAWVGVPVAIAGVGYILLFGNKLLPDRAPKGGDAPGAREYYATLKVRPSSPIIGKTVEQAGLRHLPRLFLSRIERDGESVVAVGPGEIVREGDVLAFVGALESVVDLQQIKGLEPTGNQGMAYRPNLRLIEAVVSSESQLAGQTVRRSGIRTKYGAVIVAVHRAGQALEGKIGDMRLRPGDTLLMEAPSGFAERHGSSNDFHLVTERRDPATLRHDRAWIALIILAFLVVAITSGVVTPMVGAMAAAGGMVLFRCCTGPQARSGIDWQVLVVIGAAFGIKAAMENSGLAATIAHAAIELTQGSAPWVLLAVIYALTLVFTMFMTNNAAAVLMFPIALSVTSEAGLPLLPFAVAIAVAASCEFSTPIGYQTNLMVMGPGGYRWSDYTRFGGPLTILAGIITIALVPLVFGFGNGA
ncbi:MAG: SLC13 family permease [Phycisphaerales bacterium]